MALKPKKIPLRKCTGCGEMKNKKELIRVVHNEKAEEPNKRFAVDLTGRAAGRGAYICNETSCLEKAFKQKGLERSFKCNVDVEIYNQIRMEVEKLTK